MQDERQVFALLTHVENSLVDAFAIEIPLDLRDAEVVLDVLSEVTEDFSDEFAVV